MKAQINRQPIGTQKSSIAHNSDNHFSSNYHRDLEQDDCHSAKSLRGRTANRLNENSPNKSGLSNFASISIIPPSPSTLQPKLKINAPNDKYEKEADSVAEQVMRMPPHTMQRQCKKCGHEEELSNDANQKKCSACENREEVIQTKSNGHRQGVASGKLTAEIKNTRGGGQSMDDTTRTFMESRIGADFSGVKIHSGDKAARMSQDINAKAFTLGQNIYFNRGNYAPGTNAGKKLLAHELTHTIQQGGYDLSARESSYRVQRTPDDVEEENAISIMVHVGSEPNIDAANGASLRTGNTDVEVFDPIIYEGDVLHLGVSNLNSSTITWVLPPEIELVEKVDDISVMLRVVGKLGPNEEIRKVKLTIKSEEGAADINATLILKSTDETADVLDPEVRKNESNIKELKSERKRKRQKYKSDKKALRQNFRSLNKEDRRKNRKTFKTDKANLRSARKKERKDLRKRRKNLMSDKKANDTASSCNIYRQKMINTALNRAILVTSNGLARLQKGTADADVSSNLSSIMKWSVENKNASENSAVIQKIMDVLNISKNNMLLSKHDTFNCILDSCDEETGAYTTSDNGRSGKVNICDQWFSGTLKFGIPRSRVDNQSIALLHEFIHLAGPISKNEVYVHQKDKWSGLSHENAMKMVDAYARIAWSLGA